MTDRWGHFIEPDLSLAEAEHPHLALEVPIYSGFKGYADLPKTGDERFDAIVDHINTVDLIYEDQCSAKYYFDLFRVLGVLNGSYNRVVEVGVFLGGSSTLFAAAMQDFDFDLDLVDVSPKYLRFTYERIRRTFPNASGRVRLFFGGLPEYAKAEMTSLDPAATRCLVHHDGSHRFDQVVKDLSALSFVRDKVHSIIAQDTHLRGRIGHLNFVDQALFAVFGRDMQFAEIGAAYNDAHPAMLAPNPYQGNYFLKDKPEGMVLLMDDNTFEYPHPSMSIDEFLDQDRLKA